MHFRDVYTVDEAARRLGVGRRHLLQLLGSGAVVGERHGRSWLVPGEALERTPAVAPVIGRPFGERLAWSVLAELEGRPPRAGLAREERARLRRHLARPLEELLPRLRGRAAAERLSVGSGALEAVVTSRRDLLGGARALRLVGSSRAAAVDLYLRSEDYDAFLDETLAVPDVAYPNLVVHLVSAANWPFEDPGGAVWTSAALLDLYEAGALGGSALAVAFDGLLRKQAGRAG
ncbi:MAG TPA: helix-turn-helix domain-containing protein [Acidimicrobiales bacterium]|nr:helix-turn-helix domain-containing protein [Acidimicrobiales bacterium]